mgnify:CR=1 FL=1|tara:strand:- start:19281 stop:20045 length:765 start_codon:yes stop_codon:yes gene_type:complete
MFLPKISIITAVKNNLSGLTSTIRSIREQQYPELEFIVIDGVSTDGTLDLISDNRDVITHTSSEPDDGISDAFNKGLNLATGTYINFQGAGDTLYAPNSLQNLFDRASPDSELVCGQVARVTQDNKLMWIAPKKVPLFFNKRSLLTKLTLPHQGLFTHKRFFERWGQFDESAKFAMDYDILLRAYHDFPKTDVIDVIVANWQAGGIGTNRILAVLSEYHRLKSKYQVASPIILNSIHQLNRLKYFTKQTLKMDY